MGKRKHNPFGTRYVYDPRSCARLKIHGPKPHGFIEAKSRQECELLVLAMNEPKGPNHGIRPHGGSRAYGGFGSSSSGEHVSEAAREGAQIRREIRQVEFHLKQGQCRPAVIGLAFLAYSVGKTVAHKQSIGSRRKRRGTSAVRYTGRMRSLAEKIARVCKIPNRK
jgi:hypothetical protein